MPECPRCGSDFTGAAPSIDRADARGAGIQQLVPIARFVNVAEAGYFHCELEGHLACEVRLTTENHFDAAHASWGSNYVLSVPAGEAEQATGLLKRIVDETSSSEFVEYGDTRVVLAGMADHELPFAESRIHWTPIVLTLTAGTFVIWAAKQVHRHLQQPAGGQARQVQQWEQLGRDSSPWVQQLQDGPGRRELIFDQTGRLATLREDRDGDGIFERNARISLSPAAH
ncbi:MAG: hypothetical protein AB7U20_17855 [Planctomycetaceae bacterium]